MLTTENLREMHFDSSSRLRTAFIKEDPQVRSLLAGWRTADYAPHTADRSPTIHQHTRVKAGPRVQARSTRTAPHPRGRAHPLLGRGRCATCGSVASIALQPLILSHARFHFSLSIKSLSAHVLALSPRTRSRSSRARCPRGRSRTASRLPGLRSMTFPQSSPSTLALISKHLSALRRHRIDPDMPSSSRTCAHTARE